MYAKDIPLYSRHEKCATIKLTFLNNKFSNKMFEVEKNTHVYM